MTDAPERIWAQKTAGENWEEPLATPYEVSHFHEYIRADLAAHQQGEAVERDPLQDQALALITAVEAAWQPQGGRDALREALRRALKLRAMIEQPQTKNPGHN